MSDTYCGPDGREYILSGSELRDAITGAHVGTVNPITHTVYNPGTIQPNGQLNPSWKSWNR